MKKTFLLNSALSYTISSLGHTQSICVADSGLPVPDAVKRIDLALFAGVPSFLQTLRAVLAEMQVERAVFAEELLKNPDFHDSVVKPLKESNAALRIEYLPHERFKAETARCRAVVRTGEQTPYANVLLYSGVTF